jgi:phosphoribosylformimino-5-aminoimidazole carboxamide ribotide isomerase
MIEVIPAIDIIDGKCVRLTKGDYAQKKVYSEDPLEVAKSFEGVGLRRLHVVDLDGAKAQHIVNHKALEKIATKTSLVVDFGGGLKTSDDLRIAFECGAHMVTGGSIAVKNPEEFTRWIEKFGGEKIILGADVVNEKIAVSGWQEGTDLDLLPFIKSYSDKGITQVICTDISKDGMLQGANLALYRKIQEAFPSLHLIASGGVSQLSDVEELDRHGLRSVIVGKAIYEGRITMEELTRIMNS